MSPAGTLRVRGVHKRFAGASGPALADVTLSVGPGCAIALLGASGAGKTTLLRVVAGLEVADAGTVEVGETVLSDPRIRVPPERRGVGLVFQHLELWPHMTVAENLAFGLPGRPRGRAAARHAAVLALATRVGVEHLLSRSPATLSGGERQRVAIARTLAPEPAVILYDEPLANLDPERRRDLRVLIREVCRERGAALVYVTHDAEDAMTVGDEVLVLDLGLVVDRGPPDALYRAPSSLAGARALGPMTALPGTAGDGWVDTALGRLTTVASCGCGPVLAVLRPEAVEIHADGTAATVVDVHPRGGRWAFTVRAGPLLVEGESAQRPVPGAAVRIRARGPVAVVRPAGEAA